MVDFFYVLVDNLIIFVLYNVFVFGMDFFCKYRIKKKEVWDVKGVKFNILSWFIGNVFVLSKWRN